MGSTGDNLCKGSNCVIYDNVILGGKVRLGNNVVIYPGTRIGNGAHIEDNVVLGRQPKTISRSTHKVEGVVPPLSIGENVVIGSNSVFYAGSIIGNNVYFADMVIIRELCRIADDVNAGKRVIIEHESQIGKGVKIQSGTVIAEQMTVEEGAFIGSEVSTAADKYMDRTGNKYNPPYIKRNARIGNNATLLPGIVIGVESVVGAGAVVTKDVEDYAVVVGNPAHKIKEVEKGLAKK